MTTIYKADSIRVASHQTKLPTDIGRFRPRVLDHTLTARAIETPECTGWTCSLPFGSSIGTEDTPEAAVEAGVQWAKAQGWTQDRAQAEADAIAHAKARKNAHPNR